MNKKHFVLLVITLVGVAAICAYNFFLYNNI